MFQRLKPYFNKRPYYENISDDSELEEPLRKGTDEFEDLQYQDSIAKSLERKRERNRRRHVRDTALSKLRNSPELVDNEIQQIELQHWETV